MRGKVALSMVRARLNYYRRIFSAYLTPRKSHLTFWHETPQANPQSSVRKLGEYYMTFFSKADYAGRFDEQGVPMLNYHGRVGLQYNPIAIAQYGLGNYNLLVRGGGEERKRKCLAAADWLVEHLEPNSQHVWVWCHHFDWEYRTLLKAPWFSGLAQGQGISLLVRAHQVTRHANYLEAADRAFQSFLKTMNEGGVVCIDKQGFTWFEEVIVEPPTHILNGFIWAAWGLYDYHLYTKRPEATGLFDEAVRTLEHNLWRFDSGYWSLYDLSGTRMKMLASPFYHRLHLVQLKVMHALTEKTIFAEYLRRWEAYQRNPWFRWAAFSYKCAFKLLYY